MEYVRLGRTGLTVSRLCLGCMSYGTSTWRPWILNESEARPFFRRAVELGITFFDTADMYSLGVSEEVTGRALRELIPLDQAVIATKVYFPMGDRPNMSGLSRKHIVRACEASLRRLGVDTIDLYQIHRFDANVPVDETLAALDWLVQQGKVRYIGASSGYAWQLAQALAASDRRGWARFVSMQNHYNLVYREEEREMIPLCEAEGLGVLPWSPLARGLLARPRPGKGFGDTKRADADGYTKTLYDSETDWNVVDAVQTVAGARGAPAAAVALAWLLARPSVTAPIVGATKLEQLDVAVQSLAVKLTPEECRALEAPYRPHVVKGLEGPPPSGRR
jgi:aryl-alcohol dehydrogenase-like predicted oxidoreductase